MVTIRGLSRTFRGRPIFSSDFLETPATGLVALQGTNGSGKTTLLRILSTLTAPTAGDGWIGGHSIVSKTRQARAQLGFVPASDGGMFRRLTGRENLMLFGGLCGLSAKESTRAIDRWREVVPLDEALACRFGVASSGMRQSLMLCRALLHDPQTLLLDEPSRSLDPEARTRLWAALHELATVKSVLYSSHDETEWRAARLRWQIKEGVLSCSTSS